MLTKEQIIHTLNETNTLHKFKVFSYKENIGIIYKTTIEDTAIAVERFKSFDTIQELYDFISLYKNSDKLEILNYTEIAPNIKFLKNNREYTVEMMNHDKLEEQQKQKNHSIELAYTLYDFNVFFKEKINSKKYANDIRQLQLDNFNFKKEIKDLQKTNFRKFKITKKIKVKSLSSKNIIKEDDDVKFEIDTSLNIKQLHDLISSLRSEFDSLYNNIHSLDRQKYIIEFQLKFNALKSENAVLNKQKEYLYSLQNSSIFQRFRLTPEFIQKKLNMINNNLNIPSQEQIKDNSEKISLLEIEKYDLLANLDLKNKLSLFKDFDKASTFEDKEALLEKYKNLIRRKEELAVGSFNNAEKEADTIYENLTKQFYSNLSKKEQDALTIYNSSLFLLINEITSLKNYKDMSKIDLKNSIKKSVNFKPIIRSLSILKSCISNADDETSKIFKNVINSGDIVSSLLECIHTIEEIQTKILLPHDCTLYRGIYTDYEIDSQTPNKGKFMSTSLLPYVAKQFTKANNPILVKIHLKKNMPISGVFPYTVRHSNSYDKLFIESDIESDQPKKEILLNMDLYSIKDGPKKHIIANYSFDNNIIQEHSPYQVFDYELDLIPELNKKIDEYSK